MAYKGFNLTSWLIILKPTYLNYSDFSFSPGESQQQCGHVDSASRGTFACLPAGHSWHPHTCTAYEGQRAGAHRRRGSHVYQQPGHINQIPRVQVKCMDTDKHTWTTSNSPYVSLPVYDKRLQPSPFFQISSPMYWNIPVMFPPHIMYLAVCLNFFKQMSYFQHACVMPARSVCPCLYMCVACPCSLAHWPLYFCNAKEHYCLVAADWVKHQSTGQKKPGAL